MVASNKSVKEVCDVICKHLNTETARVLINDLIKVKGNSSFEQTLKAIKEELDSCSPHTDYEVNKTKNLFDEMARDREAYTTFAWYSIARKFRQYLN